MEVTASAPAKVILFGEHAVIYGQPALSTAISLRFKLRAREWTKTTIDGESPRKKRFKYFTKALELFPPPAPIKLETSSEIPPASGLGSSAALAVSAVSALMTLRGETPFEERVAKEAFEVEWGVQGRASPTDTTTSTHGSGILVSDGEEENLLWRIAKRGKSWYLHHVDMPELVLVVGFTGRGSSTKLMVEKVARYVERDRFAREVIEDIGSIVREALVALKKGDLVTVGELMERNHKFLAILGVNTRELQRLKEAAAKEALGAKITGAGGGGSIIALVEDEEKGKRVATRIEQFGGRPYIVRVESRGFEVGVKRGEEEKVSTGETFSENIKEDK